MRPRRRFRLGVLFLFGYVGFSVAAGIFLAELTLHPGRRGLTVENWRQAEKVTNQHNADLAEVAIRARDGAHLSAWAIRPRTSHGKTVILLHGLGDNRMGMIGYAELFLAHGFTVLMPDARAHGSSGGAIATYGLLESDDIREWFDWVEKNQHPQCIYGFAESMGAAQLLQALRVEPHFCAVAVESSFASFREIAYDRVGQYFHTGPWLGRTILRPLVEIAFADARWKYGVNFEQLSPEESVAASKVPVLLIHGQDDRNIPVRHSRSMRARNPAIMLWEVPNADHCGAIGAAPQELERRVMDWFGEQA